MQIDVWGLLRVEQAGRVVTPRDFPGAKPKQLLEILVVERARTVSKSRLAELLWADDALPQNYLATLETYVSVLRQTLEPGVRARESVIVTERGGYRLDVERTSTDVEQFDRLVRRAAREEPVIALATLDAALALARGPVLEDEPYAAWADQLRATYCTRQVQALVDAARLCLITGEIAAALARAEQAVALDPFAEAAYQVIMLASYALWRQEEALRAFDRCRTLLATELGVDPMDETVALHLAILRHEDVAALLPQAAAAIPDSAPDPLATAGLLGRAEELARLERVVSESLAGAFRLVLVLGEPGIGKTRLVEAVVDQVGVPVGSNRCSDLEAELPYVALSLALRPLLEHPRQDAGDGGAGDGPPRLPTQAAGARPANDPMPMVTELVRRSEQDQPFDQFARMRLLESLARRVETLGPAVVVLDDVQWADAETIAALGYLRRRCPSSPVAVLLTCDRSAAHRERVHGLAVDHTIVLDELTPDDLQGLGTDAYRATHGHPQLVADWLQAREQGLAEGFTPALRERVITRCWALGPQPYRLLTVAAVLPEPFLPRTLAWVVGATQDLVEVLDTLVDERLLLADGEGFRFRHPVTRQILGATFSDARRAQLLARAAALSAGQPRRRSTDVASPRESPVPPTGAEVVRDVRAMDPAPSGGARPRD